MKKWQWFKYDALGNTYLVISPQSGDENETAFINNLCPKICHPIEGFDTDGILYGPFPSSQADFRMRILNPDGSEAEKSGNGIRIFARYLWDQGLITHNSCTLETLGGIVQCTFHEDPSVITVDMGHYTFTSTKIPVTGSAREVLNENLLVDGDILTYSAVSVGNPHCVIFVDAPSKDLATRLGPSIETHPNFPNRINVQFAKVVDPKTLSIEIWERGAGYTLASGTSSCAVAAVAHKLGYCNPTIDVCMPGGILKVSIQEDGTIQLTGPVHLVSSHKAMCLPEPV